jgi:hypothetical protein
MLRTTLTRSEAVRFMPDDQPKPHPVARTSPTPLPGPHRSTRAMVRRARLEHLATELLRLGNALRPPVPVEDLYRQPPQQLWLIDPGEPPLANDPERTLSDSYWPRLEIARAVARRVSQCVWPLRIQLLGPQPLAANEINLFALALLLPTGLLAGISERQRSPQTVSIIFQTPLKETTLRLAELGYISPAESSRAADTTTD